MATKQIKITEDELAAIRQVRGKYERIIFQVGQIHIQLHDTEKLLEDLKNQKQVLYDSYTQIQEEEKRLFNDLSKKYGVGSINIDNGIITQEIPDENK